MAARRRHAVLPALGLIVLAATTAVLLDARPAGAAGHDSPSTPSGGLLGGLLGGSPTTDPQHDPVGDAPTGLLGGTVDTLGSTVTGLGTTVDKTVSGVTSTLPTVHKALGTTVGGTVEATLKTVGSTVRSLAHGTTPTPRSVTTRPTRPTHPVTPPTSPAPPRTPPTTPAPTHHPSVPTHPVRQLAPSAPMGTLHRVHWPAPRTTHAPSADRGPAARTTPEHGVPGRPLTPGQAHHDLGPGTGHLGPTPASGLGSSIAARHRFLTGDALQSALRPGSPVEILATALVVLAGGVGTVVLLGGRRRPRSRTPRG